MLERYDVVAAANPAGVRAWRRPCAARAAENGK